MKKASRRPPGRPKASADTKPKQVLIIETATRLFLHQGYQKVSIDDISMTCGVTKATVYYYFPSKGALFTEAMIQMMKRIKNEIVTLLSSDKPLKERLYDVALAHFQATTTMDMDGFLRETKSDINEEQLLQMKATEDEMYETIGETIQASIQEGEVKNLDPIFAAQAFSSLLNVGHYKLKTGERLFQSPEAAAETIIDFFWDGLKLR